MSYLVPFVPGQDPCRVQDGWLPSQMLFLGVKVMVFTRPFYDLKSFSYSPGPLLCPSFDSVYTLDPWPSDINYADISSYEYSFWLFCHRMKTNRKEYWVFIFMMSHPLLPFSESGDIPFELTSICSRYSSNNNRPRLWLTVRCRPSRALGCVKQPVLLIYFCFHICGRALVFTTCCLLST